MSDPPNPSAHPFSPGEIAAILAGAGYLLCPWRGILDLAFFVLGAVALWKSRRAVWPDVPKSPGATVFVLVATAVAAAGIVAYGVHTEAPFLNVRSVAFVFAIYVPSAAVQQYVTQGYLIGRLGRRFGGRSDLATALCGGAIFSVAHLPLDGLVAATLLVGTVWGYAYTRGARFYSLVVSHAVLATLWFLGFLARDPFWALGPQ